MLEKREFDRNDFLFRFWAAIAFVAGLFSFIVFTLLLVNYLQIRSSDPVNHELLTQLRQQYASMSEEDRVLAERIQLLDLQTRKAFFTSQFHLRIGGMLLLAGVVTFLISFKNMVRWQREKPALEDTPTADKEFLAFAQARQLITWTSIGVLAVGLAASVLTQSVLTKLPTAEANVVDGGSAEGGWAFEQPDLTALQANWPSFRGPDGNGVAHYTNAPTAWDVESGENVKWKIELTLPGANSPVVWGDRVFLSAADDATREVQCYDAETGALVWKQAVGPFPNSPAQAPEVTPDTGHAAPSMVAHGNLVFAIFANGDMGAFRFDGTAAWGKNVGVPENHYGHSSSLLAHENLVFVQLDGSAEAKLIALGAVTGEQQWTSQRETISWASPIIGRTELGPMLFLNSEETVDAYNPSTGELLWSEAFLAGEVAPSPAYANGVVFSANEYAVAGAVRVGGTAEAPEPELIWEYDEYLPEVSSPVSDGERIYFGTTVGDLICLNLETGEEVWVEEVGDTFYSSPVVVGDRLYIGDMAGTFHVVKTGPEFERIAQISMGEDVEIQATPAFLDGRIYIRTPQHLYCIEQGS